MAYKDWLATRPPEVRALLTEFPPMSVVVVDGVTTWVVGCNESDMLMLSTVDPDDDAFDDERRDCIRYICAGHLRLCVEK